VSLNWREIDRILTELPLAGALIRDIRQPRHYQLVLELYRQGETFRVLFSLANPHCRLHRLTRPLPATGKPQRFVSFLRAHVRGGRLLAAGQVGRERIVRLEVAPPGSPDPAAASVLLWVRLWGGAANLIATDAQGRILDALYRRPARGEVSGGYYQPPALRADEERLDFSVRELPGPGDFNQRVERHYFALEEQAEREQLRTSALSRLRRREIGLLADIEALQRRREQYLGAESYRRCGDLILANLHRLARGAGWLTAEDADQPGTTVDIELDPRLPPVENAAAYYRRYRKAREGLAGLEEQLRQQQAALVGIQAQLARTETEQDIGRLRGVAAAERKTRQRVGDGTTPGLEFRSGAFRILVGRTAQENEQLLRRHTRGNDTWVHARDYSGAYVFIRAQPGKSVPLETLLDGATLALWYSKARQSGQGDVYYTQVKYLRRPRGGKPGLVLPTQEKNLHLRLEADRLRRLQENSAPGPPP
jgi:predicted ribosome quality control (RQC) complex YloA/Tae2 family protein